MNKSTTRTMRMRLGLIGAKGSRPWAPWSKVLSTITTGGGEGPGTLNGWHLALPVNNWNDPIGSLGDLVGGTGTFVHNRHPIHHNDAIADGYDMVQVLSSKMQVEIMWNHTSDETNSRMVWGYAFSDANISPFTHVTGNVGVNELNSMISDPRWTTGHMLASSERKALVIRVSVPSILRYGAIFHAGNVVDGLEAYGAGMVAHVLADSAFDSNSPVVSIFCHFVLFNESGLALAASSTKVMVKHSQTVRIMRNMTTADLNEMPDLHPA